MPKKVKDSEEFNTEETAGRRDETICRMIAAAPAMRTKKLRDGKRGRPIAS